MPSDIETNNVLILTVINHMDCFESTINKSVLETVAVAVHNAVTVAVATVLQASEACIARKEEQIINRVQQLDATNYKFKANSTI